MLISPYRSRPIPAAFRIYRFSPHLFPSPAALPRDFLPPPSPSPSPVAYQSDPSALVALSKVLANNGASPRTARQPQTQDSTTWSSCLRKNSVIQLKQLLHFDNRSRSHVSLSPCDRSAPSSSSCSLRVSVHAPDWRTCSPAKRLVDDDWPATALR